jgi:hypothetical protein
MIVIIFGVLLALAGLLFVGISGTTMRQRRNYRLPIGLALMAAGILIAVLGGQIGLMMGWSQP